MKRLLIFFAVCISYIAFSLLKTSKLEDHSVFFIETNSIYETIKNDGSFGKNVEIISIIDHIDKIKRKFKTGEYTVHYGESLFSFIKNMFYGNFVIRKLTIPEGYTVKMILENLNNNKLLSGEIAKIPEEGTLFPSTYFYKFNDSRQALINAMKNQMLKIKKSYEQINSTNLNIDQIIILASIIEKETGNESEKKIVSSVFHNRLLKKMRLQSDPTVIYAISKGYGKLDRKLTRKDWWFESPYNTYRNNGLPPSPICCPGKTSIEAAMNPANTEFLYFVANKDNKNHIFSKEYTKHKENIAQINKK